MFLYQQKIEFLELKIRSFVSAKQLTKFHKLHDSFLGIFALRKKINCLEKFYFKVCLVNLIT